MNISKFYENCKPTGQEDKWIPSTGKMKKIVSIHIMIKVIKTNEREKILKAHRDKRHVMYRVKNISMNQISLWKQCKQEDIGKTSLTY